MDLLAPTKQRLSVITLKIMHKISIVQTQKLKIVQLENLLISLVQDSKLSVLIVLLDCTVTMARRNFKIAKAAYRVKEVRLQFREQTQLQNARQEVIAQQAKESFSAKLENTVKRKN